MIKETKFRNIFEMKKGKKRILLTKNLAKGISVYGEKLITDNNVEYREWKPENSKLAAAIAKATR